jgi:two-component system, chemotaxis family, CheB/CheR fusion protein
VVWQPGCAEVLEPYRTQRITKDGRTLEVMLTASALVNATGEVYAIATTERQIKEKGHDRK